MVWTRSRLPGYALAVLFTIGAAILSLTLFPVIFSTRSVVFVAAVFLSTWFGRDIGPGLLSTVLGAIIFDYFFVDSTFQFEIGTLRGAVGLIGFVAVNLLITVLTGSVRRDIKQRKRDQADMTLLQNVTQSLLGTTELPKLVDRILDGALEIGPYDLGIVRLVDRESGDVEVAASRGYRDQANLLPEGSLSDGESKAPRFRVMLDVQTWVVDDLDSEPGRLRSYRNDGAVSLAVIPVRAQSEVLGTIALGTRSPHHFEPREVRLLEAFGAQVGIAIRTAQLYEETRRAYQELQETQSMLLQAQRLETAGRIAGQVAHDFNNLLAPLVGFPELIKLRLPPDHEAAEFCDLMMEAAKQMAQINEDLLTLGRRGHFEQEPIAFNRLVQQGLDQLHSVPSTLELDVRLKSDLLPVRGVPGQLIRVVANLIANGRDAMEDVGVLTVSTENVMWTRRTERQRSLPASMFDSPWGTPGAASLMRFATGCLMPSSRLGRRDGGVAPVSG
jgi:K+-sensing histidine kinase KdpD